MRPSVRHSLVRVAFVAAVLAWAAIGSSAAAVLGASITFGTPTATSTFGKGIEFTQPYSGAGTFREVDIVITYPGGFGPSVIELQSPGATSFDDLLDTSAGEIQTNTQLVAYFQVVLADGTVPTARTSTSPTPTTGSTGRRWSGESSGCTGIEGDDTFAQQALQMGEDGIAKASAFLGFTETAPIDFFVYADQTAFYDALGPGTRDNVGGEANPDTGRSSR